MINLSDINIAKFWLGLMVLLCSQFAWSVCTDESYRRFDLWLGTWTLQLQGASLPVTMRFKKILMIVCLLSIIIRMAASKDKA
jgi:hypothetical protein